VLEALQRLGTTGSSRVDFAEAQTRLAQQLAEAAAPGAERHPEYAFWRLQNDGDLWTVTSASTELLRPNSAGDVSARALVAANAVGQLAPEIEAALLADELLFDELVVLLLASQWPISLQPDVIDLVDLKPRTASWRLVDDRDPRFRKDILANFGHRCAACGYDARLGSQSFGLEAAHIMWHCAKGPNTAGNGLALCSLHHKAFDHGAIALGDDLRFLISQQIRGGDAVRAALGDLAGRPLVGPERGPLPQREFLDWHRREVFRAK
jgi:putative restriction endonuclease